MKTCADMKDVRQEIDRVDRELVPLLLERLSYIHQAGEIKPDRNTVRDDWRINDVVSKAKAVAAKQGGNTDYIETVYRHLIDLSIQYEYGVWDSRNDEK